MTARRTKTLEIARRPDPTGSRLAGRTILIADDDRSSLRRIKEALSDNPWVFIEAHDGQQALTAVRAHRPDLLLMDVEMPGLGGVEVCRIVKANQGEGGFGFIPIILITARRGGKVEGLELGADDYLVKPFDMLELSARVKSMLRMKALQDALLEKNRELDRANHELEEKRRELLALSRTDGLTGLFNRRHFEERLAGEFTRAQRYRAHLSCLLLDIDHFKRVNDTWGHPFGDHVLRQVAAVARNVLRDVDVLARYGGEELIAVLPETGTGDARAAAERVRSGIEGLQLTFAPPGKPPTEVRVTCSVGVSTYPSSAADSAERLVQAADDCLYAAKQGGRNRVVQHGD